MIEAVDQTIYSKVFTNFLQMNFTNPKIISKNYTINQAFIQALLSTAIFPQRFSFFTVFLVQWLRVVAPW